MKDIECPNHQEFVDSWSQAKACTCGAVFYFELKDVFLRVSPSQYNPAYIDHIRYVVCPCCETNIDDVSFSMSSTKAQAAWTALYAESNTIKEVETTQVCPTCNGTGGKSGFFSWQDCEACKGEGQVPVTS